MAMQSEFAEWFTEVNATPFSRAIEAARDNMMGRLLPIALYQTMAYPALWLGTHKRCDCGIG